MSVESDGRGPLSGQSVLVTGGSRGIGAATVRALHRDGAHVVIHYGRDADAAERLAESLGDRASIVGGNLLEPGGPQEIWTRALGSVDVINVLVNNAGAWIASPTTEAGEWDRGWEQNIALNLRAPADLCRLAIEHFSEHAGGVIVNVTSRSAHRGDDADHLAYGAAKGGLLALTKGIARGYGRRGILAYAVAPGWVATDLAGDAIDDELLRSLPLGEVTPAEDVAEVIAFLSSGRSRHTTGATIDITGADYVR